MPDQQQPRVSGNGDESLLRELREKALVAFAEHTTAHGIFRLTQGSTLRRLVWCLVIVGACIGFAVHLSELTQRYLSYPVSTEFSSEGADFQFPTVTLCPSNFIAEFSPALVSNYTIRGYSRTLQDMIYDIPRMYYTLQLDDRNVSMPVEAYSAYQDGKLALKALAYRQVLFQSPYETVIYCRYNSQLCDFNNFTVYKDESKFLCISFNPKNRTLVRPGEGNGLYLVLYNLGYSFLTDEEEIDNVPGFRASLHESGFKPDFAYGFNVPFGYKTSAQISMQTDVKVNRDFSPCDDSLSNVTYTVDYSRPGHFEKESYFGSSQDCVNMLMQVDYRNSCGCLGTHLPLPSDMLNDTAVCHSLPEEIFFRDIFYRTNNLNFTEYTIRNSNWVSIPLTSYLSDNWAVYNRTAQLIKCYHAVRHRHETKGVASSQCRIRCSNTRYDVTTSLASWPRNLNLASAALQVYAKDIMKRIVGSNLSDYRLQILKNYSSSLIQQKYISVLDLYPKSTKAIVSSESWAYPLRNMFSDLGGILGLWIGVSVITLLELIELLLHLAYLSLGKLYSSAGKVQPLMMPPSTAKLPDAAGFLENSLRAIYSTAAADSGAEKPELQLDISLPPKPAGSPVLGSDTGGGSHVQYSASWFQRMFSA